MTGGLPEFNALTEFGGGEFGRSSGMARNQLLSGLRRGGVEATDPAYTQTLADFEANRARAFDDSLADWIMRNEQVKQFGGNLLTSIAGASDPLAALSLRLRAANL